MLLKFHAHKEGINDFPHSDLKPPGALTLGFQLYSNIIQNQKKQKHHCRVFDLLK